MVILTLKMAMRDGGPLAWLGGVCGVCRDL